jgi:hypothetical protein
MSLSPSGHKWTHRELNPNFQSAELASSPWTIGPKSNGAPESRTPISAVRARRPPLGRAPRKLKWRRWGSNPSRLLARQPRPPGTCAPKSRSVRDSNPVFLPTKEACRRNTYRPTVIPDGIEPSPPGCKPGILAIEPRDRDASGPSVVGRRQSARPPGLSLLPTTDIPLSSLAEVGVEPTNSPGPRPGRFAGFAYSAVSAGSRSRT